MLLHSFFDIITEDFPSQTVETCCGTSLHCKIRLNPEHPIFKGHFPGCPITPGVCVIQIAAELFSHLFKQEYVIYKVKNVKFLNIIKPDETDTINYDLSWEELDQQEYRLKAIVHHDNITYAKINITLHKP